MNWERFLTSKGIEYVTSGPNTARNNISIKCIYCTDPSYHLGISLEGKGWNCWRCNTHGNDTKLIQRLIHCNWEEAERIAGIKTTITISDATLKTYVRGMMTKETKAQETRFLEFPNEIKRLYRSEDPNYYPHQILMYFGQRRGYKAKDTLSLSDMYRLRYAFTGPYRYRIVFPIYDEHQKLLTWTGRSLSDKAIRYKDLSENPEKAKDEGLPQALTSIKDCLFNYHELASTQYNKLIICEGPFDALRVDYFGRSYGIRSTCLFGKRISKAQVGCLEHIRHLYNDLYITLDSNFATDMTKIAGELSHLDCKIKRLPDNISEPECLTKQEIIKWWAPN